MVDFHLISPAISHWSLFVHHMSTAGRVGGERKRLFGIHIQGSEFLQCSVGIGLCPSAGKCAVKFPALLNFSQQVATARVGMFVCMTL